MTIILFLFMIAALVLAAFCAGTEIGFLSVNRGRVLHLAREGSKSAGLLSRAIARMSSTLTSLLVGNNLAAVVYSSSSAALSEIVCGPSAAGRFVWSFVAAFALLYLGEFLPKLFFSARPLRRSLKIAPYYRVLEIAVRPLANALSAFTRLFVKTPAQRYRVTVADLVRILQDRKNGVMVSDFESALISRIIVLRKKGEFITPDSLLVALDDEAVQ